MRPMIAVFVLAATLGVAQTSWAAAPPDAAVAHGGQLAQRCAACHAIGPEGRSPNNGAPPFRTLGLRYNRLGLEQALKRVGRFGHFDMKPQALGDADMADIAAYVAALEPPPAK